MLENIPRILPKNVMVELDASKWPIPDVFPWLSIIGGVNEFEMLRTFNCGIGGILVVEAKDVDEILGYLKEQDVKIVGKVVEKHGEGN